MRQPRRTFGVSFPVLTTRAHPLTEEVRTEARPMSTTTLADVLYPGGHAPGGPEPQSPPSDLTPNSPNGGGSSPGSDDDGSSRKRSASGSIKEGKERTANKVCRVCGDKAYSYNFNVITCESCKAFFRRNANKEKEIRCPFNESCEINVVSRRFCQRCRLFKCFQVGMKKEWIMTDEARLEKKARVEENRERRREEAKRKDGSVESQYGSGGRYRTTSVSSNGGGGGSAKISAACAATSAAAAAAAAANTAVADSMMMQQHHQQQHVQQMQQMRPMFQPELPTLVAPSTTTANMLDALAQQVAAATAAPASIQQPFQAVAALPTAAALVAAVAAPPPQPTNSELVAQAIALEQQLQQTPFGVSAAAPAPSAAATAAAVYQAAAAHHHQQQQQQQMAAAISQQIAQMTAVQPAATPQQQLDNATLAAALALPQPVSTPTSASTAAATAAILTAAAANASPLDPLTQSALIMDASSAMTQQLLAAAAAPPPPPPSAIAAVASTMMLQTPQQQLQPAAALQPDRCCCTCACGKYHAGRAIVEQAREEWETEKQGRRSNQSPGDELGLAELLPSASSVNWLNTATNQNPLTEGSLSCSDDTFPAMPMKDSLITTNPLQLPHLGIKGVDPEFGPMEKDDEMRLEFLHKANDIWTQALEGDENKLHSQSLPTKEVMLQMMVGAINRMIRMARKFPRFKALHQTDQIKLFSSCYLDVMIIRGAMAYDPKENAWKGPTNKHDYKIKMDAMNDGAENMYEQSIRLYMMFKEDYRTDESVMLLLNMIVLFDPCAKDLTDVQSVSTEHNAYKRCLKRFMYTKLQKLNQHHHNRVQAEYCNLLDRLATVRKMNSGARGIMVEHADNMPTLLKELLQRDEEAQKVPKRHSPRGVGSVSSQSSIDELPSTSAQA